MTATRSLAIAVLLVSSPALAQEPSPRDPIAAEADYKAGIAKEPKNGPCRINYGLMLARHGRIGESVVQLQTVLTPSEVHFNIACVYEFEHRPEMAKIEYREALALDPNFKDAKEKLSSLGDLMQEE